MRYLFALLAVLFFSGCLTRTYTIEKPRTNLEIQGNQGYLFGTPTQEPKPNKFGDTRTISILEVELGSHPRPKNVETKKAAISPTDSQVEFEEEITEDDVVVEGDSVSDKKYELYTVQKNDTLQKISEKFYGTTRKWKMLYDCNQDVLKSPDRVYPGKTIKIPELDK